MVRAIGFRWKILFTALLCLPSLAAAESTSAQKPTKSAAGSRESRAQTSFSRTDHYVSTIFFSNFFTNRNTFFRNRAFLPLGGLESFLGSDPAWMMSQIKDMMSANIDIVYHEVDAYGGDTLYHRKHPETTEIPLLPASAPRGTQTLLGLQNFLRTTRGLMEEGYSPPKIAEWVNGEIFAFQYWDSTKTTNLDLTTDSNGKHPGEDYFYTRFIYGFWSQYFEIMGPYADQGLARTDGKVMISFDVLLDSYTYHPPNGDAPVPVTVTGLSEQFFAHLAARFRSDFPGYDVYFLGHPKNVGSLEMGGAVRPRQAAPQEVHLAFGPNTYIVASGGRNAGPLVVELLPALNSGTSKARNHLARNGGSNYRDAWTRALSLRATTYHLGITSWNYLGEGDELTPCDVHLNPLSVTADPRNAGDTWGADPRTYIQLTANGASQWNDLPGNDAEMIDLQIPHEMVVNQTYTGTITVRNSGDNSWTGEDGYQLVLVNSSSPFSEPREVPIVDTEDEIPHYGGVFRGRPKTFTVKLTPRQAGIYSVSWRMSQRKVGWFGSSTPQILITVSSP